ncbi:MAG: hypothetical protein HRU13_08450 [Phycisphaerales bacterium]|nr:hypothetical protein [Phycisphaerales bacterium]
MRLLLILWASPATLIGLLVGVLGLITGGRTRRSGRVLEFHGGAVTWLLDRAPVRPLALTLGHVILGCSLEALDRCHEHELVHVSQYERWGPFFIPAYLTCSLVLRLRGRDAYRDNPFERAAYKEHP